MKFHLTSDQESLQQIVERTAQRVCSPERRRALLESPSDIDESVWKTLATLGFGGPLVPETFGGAQMRLEDTALAFEAIGRAATPGPYLSHALAGWALGQSGVEAHQVAWLPKMSSGDVVGAIALKSCDPTDWDLSIVSGRLNGSVRFVQGADQAKLLVVGVSEGLALVEAGPHMQSTVISVSDLTRRLWTVHFRDAPATLIGTNDDARRVVDAGLILLAADALGGAQQCLSMGVEYARQREQFGQPIGQFQALKHQLANMALEVETARALVWYAAFAWDLRLPDSSRMASHAKAHLADRFVSAVRSAIQIHGGIGYTWDFDLQIWFRRSLFDRAFLGAPSLHRDRVATLSQW